MRKAVDGPTGQAAFDIRILPVAEIHFFAFARNWRFSCLPSFACPCASVLRERSYKRDSGGLSSTLGERAYCTAGHAVIFKHIVLAFTERTLEAGGKTRGRPFLMV